MTTTQFPGGYGSAADAARAGYYGYYSTQPPVSTEAHRNRYGWTELDNLRVNAGVLDILKADSFVFRFHYDPNVEVKGDMATWFAKQPNRRVKYSDDIDYRSFKTSVSLKQNLELIEFGCYGDVYSVSFGQLAMGTDNKLKEFIELHQKNSMNELNNDILRKYKEDLWDHNRAGGAAGGNFGPNSIIYNDESVYESGTTNGKDNAEILWDSIYTQAIRMCRRSNKYNAANALSNVGSLKDLIVLMTPKVFSMMRSRLYAGTPHPEAIRLEPMFGGIGVLDFSDNEFSTDKFAETDEQVKKHGAHAIDYGPEYKSSDHIIMLGKDSYKICDSINPPLFVDTTRIGISMKTYFFKWFFGFTGFIKFVNACKWRAGKDPAITAV
jgi:hypothetical protein